MFHSVCTAIYRQEGRELSVLALSDGSSRFTAISTISSAAPDWTDFNKDLVEESQHSGCINVIKVKGHFPKPVTSFTDAFLTGL